MCTYCLCQECFYGTFACWRLPFLLQGVLQVPLCLLFYYVAPAHLDIGPQAVRRKSIDSNGGITRLLTHDIPLRFTLLLNLQLE